MFSKKFLSVMLLCGLAPLILSAQDAAGTCGVAGPDAYFCTGEVFRKLDLDQGEGVSFWLHEAGYLSKVLVEETGDTEVTQGQIETRILDIVSRQADTLGRAFAFSDLSATEIHGVPFGTFRYRLRGEKADSVVLHSYVAVKGRVLQVVSQMALRSAASKRVTLEKAHAAALRAVKIEDPSSDA